MGFLFGPRMAMFIDRLAVLGIRAAIFVAMLGMLLFVILAGRLIGHLPRDPGRFDAHEFLDQFEGDVSSLFAVKGRVVGSTEA